MIRSTRNNIRFFTTVGSVSVVAIADPSGCERCRNPRHTVPGGFDCVRVYISFGEHGATESPLTSNGKNHRTVVRVLRHRLTTLLTHPQPTRSVSHAKSTEAARTQLADLLRTNPHPNSYRRLSPPHNTRGTSVIRDICREQRERAGNADTISRH